MTSGLSCRNSRGHGRRDDAGGRDRDRQGQAGHRSLFPVERVRRGAAVDEGGALRSSLPAERFRARIGSSYSWILNAPAQAEPGEEGEADVRYRWSAILLSVPLIAGCGAGGSASPSESAQSTSPSSVPATQAPTSPTTTASAETDLLLVAVGDSIPFNSPDDCPGCTAFVDRYGDAVAAATGQNVQVRNLSEHNNLQVDGLLREVASDQSESTRSRTLTSSWSGLLITTSR